MAGRGQNPPQPQPLQGADPALVQILQMMQNRDANRDNSRKQFLMFPKESQIIKINKVLSPVI